MRIDKNNGLIILQADENKILRSRITGNKFDIVYLSKNDCVDNYIEEDKAPEEIESKLEYINNLKKSKLEDLNSRYEVLKNRINMASTKEEIMSIEIF